MTSCPLCLKCFSLTVRLLPPTKRPTILVLDGGGIRGIITLGFLKALESQVVGVGGLREAFDLNVGTSAGLDSWLNVGRLEGGLILSDVVVCGESVDEARARFITLARRIFRTRPLVHTLVGQSWDFLRSWLTDSRHDSEVLDDALQEAFSTLRRLFDTTPPLLSGIRVALTASQVDEDGSLCLFSNYRGVGRIHAQSAYKRQSSCFLLLLLPWIALKIYIADNETVHDAAWPRYGMNSVFCLASRPFIDAKQTHRYFTTKHLPNIGTFQDGGISANCPLRPLFARARSSGPDAHGQTSSLASGRTGYAHEQPANNAKTRRGFWSGGFVERAIHTFLQSPAVNSRRGWQDALDIIPENLRPDVFRLDREVAGDLPELDDSSALNGLFIIQPVVLHGRE
ncbi:predicted protein [Aspergillus nidulans FGSC A4]|uniref:PNPLA domain-containing protein n=1 Tax=Emericella nidulans (strain FGSC A4 / ATCC 38163 / CBS 112.46 / NRRL 194 / M139) TaxID=227321 RepID=Q5AR39_EMENI|nr:hypothetical protein [Aspergillus nidulans FGSC A4]EAA66308.1 predicted protein [Aspergillus nidulans FGSC A4]CBF87230.1 TPA: conserved hypothetical protein [Aspergillus nidulans FGSC A4]|eukprot:XP_682510.1 predicted protein [Aspergillus nidulans FGSC A4]